MSTRTAVGGGETTWLILVQVLMLGLLMGLLLAFGAWWKLADEKAAAAKKKRSHGPPRRRRNVMTQSQTRYAFDRATPRFVPLPEGGDGAWMDYTE